MDVRRATMAQVADRWVPSESGGATVEETNNAAMLVSVFHPLWYGFKCFNQIGSAIGRGLGIALYDSLF
jgi:hypothetical protein